MFGKGLESLIPPQSHQNNEPHSPQPAPQDNQPTETYTAEPSPAIQPHQPEEAHQKELQIIRQEPPKEAPAPVPLEVEEKIEGAVFQIEIEKIKPNPHQPRKNFDEFALRELANSIREFGVLQPLIVSKVERESEQGWSVYYELVAGERRLKASRIAGLNTVPVIIRSEPADREKLEMAIIENIQRTDLNPIELAKAIARLQDEFGLTQREIAVRLGKSREVIANTVRLLSLPTQIQEAVITGKISESHARLLLSIDDIGIREKAFQDILNENLNVRDTDARIKKMQLPAGTTENKEIAKQYVDSEISFLKEKLEEFLGTKVNLESRGKSGKITISFYSPEELEEIVQKVTRQSDNQSLLPPSGLSA